MSIIKFGTDGIRGRVGEPPIDCDEHLKHSFGECAQAHLDRIKTNDNVENAIDTICLCPSDNSCGGHVVMNPNTGKHITRPRVTNTLLTECVKE